MLQSQIQLEASIKKHTTRLYKDVYGKGPEETAVRIWGNILIIKFTGSLTPIEESIRHAEGGEELIHKIRDILILNQTEYFVELFEKIIGLKVMDINYMIGKNDDNLYIFVILEKSVIFEN